MISAVEPATAVARVGQKRHRGTGTGGCQGAIAGQDRQQEGTVPTAIVERLVATVAARVPGHESSSNVRIHTNGSSPTR